jgi:uncharacterized OsmC-like protein
MAHEGNGHAESERTAVTRVRLTRVRNHRFRVRFRPEEDAAFITDEPAPLGRGEGPGPIDLLAAAVGNCMASSLLFCTQKARVDIGDLEADVRVSLTRNSRGRLRIGEILVTLAPSVTDEARQRMGRCLEVFESFCTVAESVRQGIPVRVEVLPRGRTETEAVHAIADDFAAAGKPAGG